MWNILRLEFMEADVDAIVVGFVAGEGLPFSDGFLDGVVGGLEGFCIGALLGGLLHHVAEVGDGSFGRGDATLDAHIVEAGKECGGFGFCAIRQEEGLVRSVTVSEDAL